MQNCMGSAKVHARLKKIIGQLNAIDKMVDREIPCEQILIQINAAKSALHKVGQLILEGHLHSRLRTARARRNRRHVAGAGAT